MVSFDWCLKQSRGIELIESNFNMSNSYIEMAENSLGTMYRERNKNDLFSISAGYYAMYSSLYSVLIKIGLKCEIHQCSIKLMEVLLGEFYSSEDVKNISKAFKLRNIVQYYVDRILKEEDIRKLISSAPEFVLKSKEILNKLNEDKIKELRKKFEVLVYQRT